MVGLHEASYSSICRQLKKLNPLMAIECMKINPWIVLKPPQSQRRRFLINNVSEAN